MPAVSTGSVLLRAVGTLLLLVVGVALAWQAGAGGSAFGVVFGVLVAGLGVLSLLQLALDLQPRGGGTSLGESPEGVRATVLPRRRATAVLSGLALLLLGGCLVAGAVVTATQARPVLAVVLALLALPLLGYLGALLAGRMPAGGVYLTPEAIVDAHSGTITSVPWDDVVDVRVGSPTALVLRGGAAVVHRRTAPPGWRPGVRAPQDVVGIDVRHLREDPAVAGYLLLAYHARPELRSQLGTPASLDWEILRKDS